MSQETGPLREEQGLAIVQPPTSSELAPMNIAAMKRQVEAVKALQREILEPNEDYGVIPGTGDKPTLLKPGAEKLINYFQLAVSAVDIFEKEEDNETGHASYKVRVTIINRANNQIVGIGVGACSTRERKYQRADPWITRNTALKMAKKRALVDAALTTTAASGIFTQDVEELAANGDILPEQRGAGMSPQPHPRDPSKVYAKGDRQWRSVDVYATQEGTSKSSGKPFIKLTTQVDGADFAVFIWHNRIDDYKSVVPSFPYMGPVDMLLEEFGDKGDSYSAGDFRMGQSADYTEVDEPELGAPMDDEVPWNAASGLSPGD